MEHSDLVNALVDLVGPRIDPELARELAAVQPGIWYVRQDEPSPPAVLVFER